MSDLSEKYKTCGRCIHDEEGDIVGSACYLCKRNPDDHRIDLFEERGMNTTMNKEVFKKELENIDLDVNGFLYLRDAWDNLSYSEKLELLKEKEEE